MDAQITLSSGDVVTDYAELMVWLEGIPALKPHINPVERPIGPNDLSGGGFIELLSVALGSGGVGVALAKALGDWLKSRQIPVVVKITANGKTAELHAPRMTSKQIDDALGILGAITRASEIAGGDATTNSIEP